MANKKFSEFDTKTNPSDVEFVVGYDGTDNVKIAPSDLAPAVTVPVGADPQAEISGAKVNGTATTFMRSDAAPPLSDTGVTANTYGDSSNVPQITVDAKGRITNIQTEYTNFKINKGEAITAVGTTAIIEAAYSEGVIGIAT